MIFVKTEHFCERLSYKLISAEIVVANVNTEINRYVAVGIYRPPNTSVDDFLEELNEVVKKVHNRNPIILGYFHIDATRINKAGV